MHRLLFAIGLVLCCCHTTYCLRGATEAIDSSMVDLRKFDQAALDRFSEHPDFQYDERRLDLTWWQRFKQWVRYQVAELMSREGSRSLLKNTLLILGAAALIYLVMKLLGMDAASIFSRKPQAADAEVLDYTENIHAIDFDRELQGAIASRNYRLAVRLLYLDCLKKLSDRRLVEWLPAKTNTAYVAELCHTPLGSAFRQLTRQFEYIWYGDFKIDQQHFVQLHEAFRQFDEELR